METTLTDLELIDKFITECRQFINPFLYNQVRSRGLYDVINRLPSNIEQAKGIARERMIKMGKLEPDGSQKLEIIIIRCLAEGYIQSEIPALLKKAGIKPCSLRTVEAVIRTIRERHGAKTMFHLAVILNKENTHSIHPDNDGADALVSMIDSLVK